MLALACDISYVRAVTSMESTMKPWYPLILASLVFAPGCGDSQQQTDKNSSAVPRSTKRIPTRTAPKANVTKTPQSKREPTIELETPPYSPELAESLITEVGQCKVVFSQCPAFNTLVAFGNKATQALVAAAIKPKLDVQIQMNLLAVLIRVNDPAAAAPLFAAAKPKQGSSINILLDAAMDIADEEFIKHILATADAMKKENPLDYQIAITSSHLCMKRKQLADILFAWADRRVRKGSRDHTYVASGCARYVTDQQAAKTAVNGMLAAMKDKAGRIEIAKAGVRLGDGAKARIWLDLHKDKIVGGTARAAILYGADQIPDTLIPSAIEALEYTKKLAKQHGMSTMDIDGVIDKLKQ